MGSFVPGTPLTPSRAKNSGPIPKNNTGGRWKPFEVGGAHASSLAPLQQPRTPPGEEVRRVAVVLPGARPGRRVLVPHQRALPAEVTQGAVVTIRADVARLQPGIVGGPVRVRPDPPLPMGLGGVDLPQPLQPAPPGPR